MTVLDASTALAFSQNEQGADVVREHLEGAVLGAANLAEVLSRLGGPVERSLAEAIHRRSVLGLGRSCRADPVAARLLA